MNEEMLHAYLDGELSAEEAAAVERKLAADATLAAKLEKLRAVDASLDLLPSIEATFDAAAVMRRRRGAGRVLRLVAPLAAAAALVLALLPRAPDDEPTTEAVFTTEEQVQYLYWETDAETYGSGALSELEGDILAELEPS